VLTLSQGRATSWPGGIAVLELAAPPGLLQLHGSLADVLRTLDWPVEARPFRPHVTFARHAQGAQPPREMPALPAWTVDQGYVLARSVPGHGYEVLQTYT
jgi:2'-5' RNA ligase